MASSDVTLLASDQNSVTVVINNSAAYTLTCLYPELRQTTKEAQTVYGVSEKVFLGACDRYRITTVKKEGD